MGDSHDWKNDKQMKECKAIGNEIRVALNLTEVNS